MTHFVDFITSNNQDNRFFFIILKLHFVLETTQCLLSKPYTLEHIVALQ